MESGHRIAHKEVANRKDDLLDVHAVVEASREKRQRNAAFLAIMVNLGQVNIWCVLLLQTSRDGLGSRRCEEMIQVQEHRGSVNPDG